MADFISNNLGIVDALLVVLGLVIYVTASKTLHQRRHPSAAIAWVMGILLLPYLAIPLYLAFGSRKLTAHRAVRRMPSGRHFPESSRHSPVVLRTLQLGRAMGLPSPLPYENLHIHQDGKDALLSLRRLFHEAKHSLDISTFLLGRNALGEEVIETLISRAKEGVKIRFLIDGIGIYMGGYPDLKRLTDAGIDVVRFVPPFRSSRPGRTNLRNHRKMVIADKKRLWCGGRNLSAEYFEGDQHAFFDAPTWIDLSFDLSGKLVIQAEQQFEIDWAFATECPIPEFLLFGQSTPDLPSQAQVIDSGPDRPDDTLHTLLISACFTTQRRILAVTPYFVPDTVFLAALMLAARRGIRIDLVLPTHSNHRLADFARHRALRDLVSVGGRVWLHPRMIHAKAVIIDDDLALVGSANLDGRSLFLNYEMMVAFYDQNAIGEFSRWVEGRRKECTPYIARRPHLLRDILEGLALWLGFQL